MEKNRLMMVIIIVLLVVLLGAIAGASFYIINAMNNAQAQQTEGNWGPANPNLSPGDIELVKLSSAISTNLCSVSENDNHVIKISLSIGIDKTDTKTAPDFIALVTEKEPIVRDAALGIIRNMTYAEAKASDAQQVIASEILSKLQEIFMSNKIVQVYIDDIYVN